MSVDQLELTTPLKGQPYIPACYQAQVEQAEAKRLSDPEGAWERIREPYVRAARATHVAQRVLAASGEEALSGREAMTIDMLVNKSGANHDNHLSSRVAAALMVGALTNIYAGFPAAGSSVEIDEALV